MKQLLILFLLLCTASVVQAQDVIVKKDGSTVVCRVVELNTSEIVYKKWGDLNGANYIMDRSLASAINYENGKKEQLGEVQNQYQPGNQNDGTQQYNDRALLAMDVKSPVEKKIRKKKIIGWIGGVVFCTIGIGNLIANSGTSDDPKDADEDKSGMYVADAILIGGGIAWTWGFLSSAKRLEKNAQMLQTSSLYKYDIQLSSNSSLTAGIDLLKDNMTHNQTLGLGLRYNF